MTVHSLLPRRIRVRRHTRGGAARYGLGGLGGGSRIGERRTLHPARSDPWTISAMVNTAARCSFASMCWRESFSGKGMVSSGQTSSSAPPQPVARGTDERSSPWAPGGAWSQSGSRSPPWRRSRVLCRSPSRAPGPMLRGYRRTPPSPERERPHDTSVDESHRGRGSVSYPLHRGAISKALKGRPTGNPSSVRIGQAWSGPCVDEAGGTCRSPACAAAKPVCSPMR